MISLPHFSFILCLLQAILAHASSTLDTRADVWTVRGSTAPPVFGIFDSTMKSFMQANGVRAAQLSISKKGALKFSHAYTWGPTNYPITQTTHKFLLASVSKAFARAAISSLYDARKLSPSTRVYPLLKLGTPKDARSNSITVKQLTEHTGGFDRAGPAGDPTYRMRDIALELGKGAPVCKAISATDMARYMYTRHTLDYAPGSKEVYSNYGYVLLTLVVEKVTGQKYLDYLRNAVLTPLGITSGVKGWPTGVFPRPSDEVRQEDPSSGLSALQVCSATPVPAVYGGDGMVKEVAIGSAGVAASANAVVKLIWKYAVAHTGPRRAGNWAHSGSTPGVSTMAFSRDDGIDWALNINGRNFPGGNLDALISKINDSLNKASGSI